MVGFRSGARMVHDGIMSLARAGRPRLHVQRRPGTTARDEILDAAGELFTTLGYTGTSTRTIADSVGIRQASLYHYFKTKDDILCDLLSQTVAPTLSFIPSLLGAQPALSAAEHLHALAAFDGGQLLSGPLESRRALPAARTARRPAGTVLVGPRAAAAALPGAQPGRRGSKRRARGRGGPAVPPRRVAGEHVVGAARTRTLRAALSRRRRLPAGARHPRRRHACACASAAATRWSAMRAPWLTAMGPKRIRRIAGRSASRRDARCPRRHATRPSHSRTRRPRCRLRG